ncbi:MAG: phenylalanine--tRNA ligase subunit beta, partial [Clostridia bacterium]|nr:phenylalanine--tRNA ligase subunit beta [Clostridia bacterium]
EELERMYGYDKLPVTIPKSSNESIETPSPALRRIAKTVLVGLGMNEIQTYSFVSPKSLDKVRIPEDSYRRAWVKLINPLGEDTSVMRTMILPNALNVAYTNYSRNIPAVAIFELGNTFYNNGKGEGVLPEEKDALCMLVYGEGENFFTMKGRVAELLSNLGIKNVEYATEKENPSFHPGRCANLIVDGQTIGTIGQVHPEVADNYGIDTEIYAAEIEFCKLYGLANTEKRYAPLPKYPAMVRDFAMVVAEEVKVGDLEKEIKANAGQLLESVKLFDVYRGAQILVGTKSVAFSLTYRAADRTLTDAEVNEINTKVLTNLKDKFNAVLREM